MWHELDFWKYPNMKAGLYWYCDKKHSSEDILPFPGGENGAAVRDDVDETFYNGCWAKWWRQNRRHPNPCQGANFPGHYYQALHFES
jgi:hypothetical protein